MRADSDVSSTINIHQMGHHLTEGVNARIECFLQIQLQFPKLFQVQFTPSVVRYSLQDFSDLILVVLVSVVIGGGVKQSFGRATNRANAPLVGFVR